MGRTIGAAPTGEKFDLLQDKPVYIGIASGGIFTGDHAKQPDFLTSYLTAAFGCVGTLQATAFLNEEQLNADREALVSTMDTTNIGRIGLIDA